MRGRRAGAALVLALAAGCASGDGDTAGGQADGDADTAAVVATALFSGFGASGEVFLDDNRGPVLVRIQMYLDR